MRKISCQFFAFTKEPFFKFVRYTTPVLVLNVIAHARYGRKAEHT